MGYTLGYYYEHGNTNNCTSQDSWIPGVSFGDVNDANRDAISNCYLSLLGRYGEFPAVELYLDDWINGNAPSFYGSICNMVYQGGLGSGEIQAVANLGMHNWGGQGSCPPQCTTLSTSLSVSPNTIVQGNSATLTYSYSGTNISTITVTDNLSSGATVSPGATKTYYITVTNACGITSSASDTLQVLNIPANIQYFRANNDSPSTSCFEGDLVTLSWSTLFAGNNESASSASINQGIGAVTTGTGTYNLIAPAQDTTYTLTIVGLYDGQVLQESVTVNILTPDSTPDFIAFDSIEDAAVSTTYNSNLQTITGIAVPINFNATNGATISVDGGAYQAGPISINNNSTVRLQMQSSSNFSTLKTSSVISGTTQSTWKITTTSQGSNLPNSFDFIDVQDAPISTLVISNTVTMSGLTQSATVSAPTNGFTSSVNGGPFDSSAKTINNGQSLRLSYTTSQILGDTAVGGVSVGGGALVDWSIQNLLSADNSPSFFDFVDKINQAPGTYITSDILNITGINVPTQVTVTNGAEFRINGGSWTTSQAIQNNQSLQLRILSSTTPGASVETTCTVGNLNDIWRVFTTTSGDTIPDAFYFVDKINQAPNTLIYSNTVLIEGISSPSPIVITGGEFQINGGSWQNAGSINNGSTLRLRIQSSSNLSTSVSMSITLG